MPKYEDCGKRGNYQALILDNTRGFKASFKTIYIHNILPLGILYTIHFHTLKETVGIVRRGTILSLNEEDIVFFFTLK